MSTMTIKEQIAGELQLISADEIRGMTVRECYTLWNGRKVVVELVTGTGGGFITGTEKARDYYRAKGHKALTFAEALEVQKAASYMDEVIIPQAFILQGNVCQFEWGNDIGMKEGA